eukprot:2108926-Amphidinium_carterae.4
MEGRRRNKYGTHHVRFTQASDLQARGDGVYRQHGENLKCRTCGTDATEAGPDSVKVARVRCPGTECTIRLRSGIGWHQSWSLQWIACMPFARPWKVQAIKEVLESTPGEVAAK